MKKKVNDLLDKGQKLKLSTFIDLSPSEGEKNTLKIKNVLKNIDVSDDQRQIITKTLNNPYKHESLGFFVENESLIAVKSLHYPFEAEFKDQEFFILPFFDYRNRLLKNLYLLNLSKKLIELYKVEFNKIVKIELEGLKSLEEIEMKFRDEKKSIQHFGKEKVIFHGQNATTEKDRIGNILKTYAAGISKVLQKFLYKQQDAVLIIASTKENIDLFKNQIKNEYLAPIHLQGNFEHKNGDEILNLLKEHLNSYSKNFAKDLIKEKDIDVNQSNKFEKQSFRELMSEVQKGSVEVLYVGKLGINDADYSTPLTPTEINSIAEAVLNLGGEVFYFPEAEFEFSKNNLLFKLRY